jgi:uncharacterized repeat protein (TIGR03803 family)
MTNQPGSSAAILVSSPRRTAFALALLYALTLIATQSVQAQTYTVLHTFSGGADGGNPLDGLSMDRAGNLYGTTGTGGNTQGSCAEYSGCGVVFQMKHFGSSWVLTPLYSFTGSPDGRYPYGRVIFGPDGALYGTTQYGGHQGSYGEDCGVVYRVAPPATAPRSAIFPWTETILYSPLGEGGDGCVLIDAGGLSFDASGNLFGTSYFGGSGVCCGTVFEVTRSDNQWTPSVLYSFTGGSDGENPSAGVTLDQAGDVFGTTNDRGCSGNCQGTVFQLVPSQSGWIENTLYAFVYNQSAGNEPEGGVILDGSGNLYGSTVSGGIYLGGTLFQLAPSGGTWTFNLLYSFQGGLALGPFSDLLLDSAGNLYGTTYSDGRFGFGSAFKLSPSGDSWIYTSLYDFHGLSDGGNPQSNLIMDAAGNLYGTASTGGSRDCESGCGVVFEITP